MTSFGTPIKPNKFPIWLKLFFGVLALFAIIQTVDLSESNHLTGLVNQQLTALQTDQITKAYFQFGSEEFQSSMSLKAFRKLLKEYPILLEKTIANWNTPQLKDNLAMVTGTLIGKDNQSAHIEYELIKENNRWKILGMLLAIPSAVMPSEGLDLIIPIDAQLRDLRNKNISKAYQETSTDFQKVTSEEDFKKFIEKYPVLITHQQITVKSKSIQGDKANVVVVLDPETENVSVQYMLIHEIGGWKIWSMNVLSGYAQNIVELMQNRDSLKTPIEAFFKSLKEDNITEAYYGSTSKEFQSSTPLEGFRKFVERFPVLTEYEDFEIRNPVIDKGTGKVEVNLHTKNSVTAIDFTLGIENNQWKIWGMQILKQAASIKPSDDVTPASILRRPTFEAEDVSSGGPMQFSKIELGNKIDVKGAIIDPQSSIRSAHEEIYVNLYIKNGISGDRIVAKIKHVESQSELPPISTTLQQNGNSVVSFSFSPPAVGWPKGTYLLEAESGSGIKRNFSFIVE